MSKYKQVFTLRDIFTNTELKDVLPVMSYKEITQDDQTKIRTSMKSVRTIAFNTSITSAKPYYSELKPIREKLTLILSGNMNGNINECQDAIYNALVSQKNVMSYACNNMDMIRDALKWSEKQKMQTGINSKLYLRVSSLQEIKTMTPKQIKALMADVMDNIYYGDFWTIQEKYGVEKMEGFKQEYDERESAWRKKVGAD